MKTFVEINLIGYQNKVRCRKLLGLLGDYLDKKFPTIVSPFDCNHSSYAHYYYCLAADEAGAIAVSVRDGAGTERLIERITGHTDDLNQDNQTFMARRRHVEALKRAAQSLDQATTTFAASRSGELMAEDLRDAQRQLNEITGEFTSDDLLGRIFASFCIGK